MNKWLELVKVLGPVILMTVAPALAPISALVIHAIGEAEAIAGKTGAEKLLHATAIVQDGIGVTNTIAQHQIIDPVGMTSAIQSGASAVVDAVNAVQPHTAPSGV